MTVVVIVYVALVAMGYVLYQLARSGDDLFDDATVEKDSVDVLVALEPDDPGVTPDDIAGVNDRNDVN